MIDLAMAGKDWEGWHVGPWGRAKCWKLHAPDGAAYYPSEVAEVYQLAREVDYLRMIVRQLRARLEPGAVALTPEVALALRVAAELIIEAVPRLSRAGRLVGGQLLARAPLAADVGARSTNPKNRGAEVPGGVEIGAPGGSQAVGLPRAAAGTAETGVAGSARRSRRCWPSDVQRI